MFWTVVMTCSGFVACSIPEAGYNPAFSFYATKEACERRVALADSGDGLKMSCISSDTVTFNPAFGFSANASIMVKPR